MPFLPFRINHFRGYQGEKLGRGGVDLTPSEERFAPLAPSQFRFNSKDNPESITHPSNLGKGEEISADANGSGQGPEMKPKLLPRETGHDIGMGSPVPLSAEAVSIITNLRNMKVSHYGRDSIIIRMNILSH